MYEGAFSDFLISTAPRYNLPKQVYRHTFETTKDLNAPSLKKMYQDFAKDYNSNPKLVKKIDAMINTMLYYGTSHTKKEAWKYNGTRQFLVYNLMLENDMAEVQKLIKRYSKQGYNAIIDMNNAEIYNDALEPFMVFNGKKTLKEVEKAFPISPEEIEKNEAILRKRSPTGTIAL